MVGFVLRPTDGPRDPGRGNRSYRTASLWITLLFVAGPAVQAQSPRPRFINPPGLTRPTGYTHVVGRVWERPFRM
jgi:hypothetical protein